MSNLLNSILASYTSQPVIIHPETLPTSSVSQIASDLISLQTGRALSQSTVQIPSYLSQVEEAILKSTEPISLNESEEIIVNGQRGVWVNRDEVTQWRGELPIDQYEINQDPSPEIIKKSSNQSIEYIQDLAIRYLRPPTPPNPGEIIINQLPDTFTQPAPPLIIRQQPIRPQTPEPLLIREAPPVPPPQVGRKVITISGKRIPPPPRKVIIERLAPLPAKPQPVLIERWLPYNQPKRKVVFYKPSQPDPIVTKQKNVIIQWEAPPVIVRKEIKNLGVIRANPIEYVQRYGSTLKQPNDLPKFVTEITRPKGLVLASEDTQNNLHELYGDVSALNLVDLDREGLSEYKEYLAKNQSYQNIEDQLSMDVNDLIEQIFRSVDRDQNGRISVEDAEKLVLKLNSRLGRRYGEDDVKAFFTVLDQNNDGTLDLDEFRRAFLTITN